MSVISKKDIEDLYILLDNKGIKKASHKKFNSLYTYTLEFNSSNILNNGDLNENVEIYRDVFINEDNFSQ